MAATEEDEYEIPLRDQRYFGAGIKRKRIQFVPSTSNEAAVQSLPTTPSQSAADKYLSIVFKDSAPAERAASAPPAESAARDEISESTRADTEDVAKNGTLGQPCAICGRPVTTKNMATTHESSIAHQICLQHSHPPSHIDRTRKG